MTARKKSVVGVLVLVAVAGLAAAAIRLRPSHHDAPVLAPLDVEVSGCEEITRAPACATSAGSELRLWIPGSRDAVLAVTVDGRALESTTTVWPDGETLRIVVPSGARLLGVRSGGDAGVAAAWAIRLVPAQTDPPVVQQAKALRAAGRLDEAATLLEAAAAHPDAGRYAVIALLARVDYGRGHIDDAVVRFREAIALDEAEGRSWSATYDATSLMFLLLERGRFSEVRPLLAATAERARSTPEGRASEGRAWVTYYEGLLAWDTGDLRSALRLTRDAERHAARLGTVRVRRMAAQSAARQLLDLGRAHDALEALRHLLDSDGDQMSACDRADLLDNVGWAALSLTAAAPGSRDADPRDPLERALTLFRASCPDPNRIANTLVNVALSHLQRGRLVEASAALEEAKRAEHEPGVPVVLFWLHLDGRIALESGDPAKALASFVREADGAAALGTTDDQRMAAEDRAEALLALGRKNEALAVLEAADALLDASAAWIPLGEGKGTFFATRDHAAILRTKLLVDLHREADAMLAARHARARVLDGVRVALAIEHLDDAARGRWEALVGRYRRERQAIDASAAHDWELSSDRLAEALERRRDSAATSRALFDEALAVLAVPRVELRDAPRALRRGEIELLYFPTDDGWLGFVRSGERVRAAGLGRIDTTASPEELGHALLGPFDAEIARASRVSLLLYGAVRSVDVHALPWRGHPLLDHAVVDYVLDLGDPPDSASASLRRALVVADPSSDLPAARDEADAVASAFTRTPGWAVQSLRGLDARADPLRAALQGASLFHYAGHATFGGPDGVDSALPLASGGQLTPGDVLALPKVPRVVSLFGCDTGRESANGALDALGLANAFLAAGASDVLATSRIVDDRLARDVATRYYARLLESSVMDPPGALRDALIAVRADAPGSDWAAFRALVR